MNDMIQILDNQIQIKEWAGQRVVTFQDIDTVHQRARGTASRNFRDNRDKFIEGTDFFKVCADEIRRHKILGLSNKTHETMTLITESGYLMIVKSLHDDLAWAVQRALVNTYFKVKEEAAQVEETTVAVVNHETILRAATIMASCLEPNRPYVVNLLREIVPTIDQAPTVTVQVEDKPIEVPQLPSPETAVVTNTRKKTRETHKYLLYPVTKKENVEGMDLVEENISAAQLSADEVKRLLVSHNATADSHPDIRQRFINDNLLDNHNFAHPINQRGQTRYEVYWASSYTIDRWKLRCNIQDGSRGSIQLEDGGIRLTNLAYTVSLLQILDEDLTKYLLGKTVTLSFLINSGTIFAMSCDIPLSPDDNLVIKQSSFSIESAIWTLAITYVNTNGAKNLWVDIETPYYTSCLINAAKLELGERQTLAHQENGKWVLNEIPNYQTELAKCRHYYRPASLLCYGTAKSASEVTMMHETPEDMRISNPTFVPTYASAYMPNGWSTNNASDIKINGSEFTVSGLNSQVAGTFGYGTIRGAWNAEL